MFRGISSVNLDTKGRMAVPSRYRTLMIEEFEGSCVVTIDTETQCLLLYPALEWEKIEAKIEALPSFNAAARRIQRLLIGHATDVELDSQARILIPPLLRDYAALEKRIMLVGQGKKFEIWDESNWQAARDAWLLEANDAQATIPDDLKNISL